MVMMELLLGRMTDVSILVMVILASFVFQVSDATIGSHLSRNNESPQPQKRQASKEEDFTWKFNGEVNIGVLVNLHHDGPGNMECGLINIDAIQQVVAAKWAIDVINNQSLPHELRIGLQVHDTCNSEELIQKHLYHVISTTREAASVLRLKKPYGPPLLGMIGIGEPATLTETTGALHAFNIPLISVTPHTTGPSYSNVLTTAPDMAGQARALANLAYEMNAKRIALISSSRATVHTLLEEATALGIRVPNVLDVENLKRASDLPQKVELFLKKMPGKRPVVVVIVEAVEAVAIAEYLKHVKLPNDPIWLVGSLGLDLHKLSAWRTVFHGGLFVEPHMPELAEFKTYFIEALQKQGDKLSELITEYKEEMFGCSRESEPSSPKTMQCENLPVTDIELRYQQDAQVSFVVKAVSALTAAFRLVQLDHCSQSVSASCLRQVHPDLHEDILTNLRKLSFTSMGSAPTEVKGTQHHFTRNGRLVANKQLVFQINQEVGMESIGWYSEDEGLKLSLNVESANSLEDEELLEEIDKFGLPAEPVSSPLINNDRSLHGRSFEQQDDIAAVDLVSDVANNEQHIPVFTYESFISRTWTLVVLAVAIAGTCIALWMFIYVLIKMCDGTLTGNQTMGLILLLGVTGLFASVIPWLLPPNQMICSARHFLHPLIMVLCFAILLVKAMQLRSLVSVGLGGTIPQINQIVSLVFMLLVQVVIAGEWYAASQPLGISINDGYPECNVSKKRFLLLHLYPCTLLLLAFFYGITVLKIKRNFNEGRWITCATIFIVPVFLAWSLVYYFAPVPFHDPSVAVSIVAVAGILLAAIFVPKMHTIAHQSKMKNLDLYRSHSDSTVFTGFSAGNGQDFLAPFPPSKKHKKYYPIYHGYPFLPPPQPSYGRLQPPPPFILASPAGAGGNAGNFDFNGLNYVSAHQRRGPRMTTYSEWASRNHHLLKLHRRRHSSSPMRNSDDQLQVMKKRSKSSSRGHQHVSSDHQAPDRGRPRTKRSNNANAKLDPQHYLRLHTKAAVAKAEDSRKEHSKSPSDGMILTASGLRDMNNSAAAIAGHNNVVIVDGVHHAVDDNVYLTTS